MDREEAIQEIHRRIDIKRYLHKAPHGGYFCPFCDTGTGKNGTGGLQVFKGENRFHCFACNRSGDVIDIIAEERGLDFNAALESAAAEIGITIDRYSGTAAAQRDFAPQPDKIPAKGKETPQRGAQSATEPPADYRAYYKECAARLSDPAAVSYLTGRGISTATAAAVGIGYDPAWISPTVVKRKQAEGNSWRPDPTRRIIAPVSKNHYVARALDQVPDGLAKMNETGGGPVGIFNLAAVYKNPVIFVVEGFFDALSILEVGAAAVALNSTTAVKRLLAILAENPAPAAVKFICCLDNDDAGSRANSDLIQGLAAQGYFTLRADITGTAKDANDALKADRAAFKAMIDAAIKEASRDALTDFFDAIQGENYKPFPTGIQFFDRVLTGGMIRQTLLLLLAAPATGKTTLMQQVAESLAIHGTPVIYLNLEMSREQMLGKAVSRLLSGTETPLTALEVMQGYKWTPEQKKAVTGAVERYRRDILPRITYNPDGIGSELSQIRDYLTATGERAKAAGQQAPVVVLDYLHLVSDRNGLDVQELIKQTVEALKRYAIQYNTLAVAITATNRDSMKDGKITINSGRDSSNTEYTADYMLGLNYEDIDAGKVKPSESDKIAELQQQKPRRMIIRCLKSRFGIAGRSEKVAYDAAHNIFYGDGDFMPVGNDDSWNPFEADQGKDGAKLKKMI